MNMISTGAFLNEMDASNKQPSTAEKFAAVWEKKNAKAARAGGVSLMALSLAACGSSSTTTSSTSTSTTTTTTSTAADTIALTAGLDTATGGAGDTTINALTDGHLEASDTITGGAGTDTLVIRDYDTSAGTFTMSGVENIDINFATSGTTLDLEDVTGLTSLSIDAAVATVTVANAEDTHALTLANIASGVTTVNVDFEDGEFDGTNTYSLTLNDVDDALSLSLDTYGSSVEAIETLTIDTGSNANGGTVTLTAEGANAETVTITGSASAKLAGFTSGTVNASGASGALTLTMSAEESTITGGSGNDTIIMGSTLTYEDTIDGGDGTDVLSISTASGTVLSNASTGNVANVSNIETLTMSAQLTAATTIDMSKISGLTKINFADIGDGGASDHVTISKAPDNLVITATEISTSADTLAADIIVNFAANTATNNLTLELDAISTPDLVNTDGYADALTIKATNTNIISVDGYQADSLTVTGTGSLDLTSAGSDTLNAATSTFDASAATGVVKAIASATGTEMTGGSAGDTLTGGAGADVIAGGAGNDTIDGKAGNDTINGGAGADTITGEAGLNTITGGAGVDKFVIEADDNDNIIKDFTVGTAGDDIEFANDLLNQAAGDIETGSQSVQIGAKGVATAAGTTIRVVTDADILTVAADSSFTDIETDFDNLIGSGDGFLTLTSGATTDDIAVVLDGNDGNSYVFTVLNNSGAGSIATGDTITLVAVLENVATADLVAANFIA